MKKVTPLWCLKMFCDKILQQISKIVEEENYPFYVYDLDNLKKIVEEFSSTKSVKLWYAQKANPLSSILRTMHSLNVPIDCASLGEVEQALRNGYSASQIISTGPSKSKAYLKTLVERGVRNFVLESQNQAYWLNEVAKDEVDVLLRIQKSNWKLSGQNVIGGNQLSQFGLEVFDWKKVNFRELKNLNILGFHIFQWGNILNRDELFSIWDEIFIDSKLWAQELGLTNFPVIDLGGGLGIPYSTHDKPLVISEILEYLESKRIENQLEEIWLELGRFLVGPVGYYANRIVDIKEVQGVRMLILEGGINHMIRGTLAKQYFPAMDLRSDSQKSPYRVYGPLCTSLDYLGEHHLSSQIEIGDWLVFTQCGAYGFSESMPLFLCHDLPAEFIFSEGNMEILRTRQKIDSLMR
ncbi:MAG: PLP-dependent decarboxylase [Halobacteriovoraceae bacterium]|nr:PLP-dependent decarboxylase [Halobacteriovoraceae bacterium]MCB9093862.1 PLP-dependent decarboxylase [Halobacteriovoraceae bacterium]